VSLMVFLGVFNGASGCLLEVFLGVFLRVFLGVF